MNEMTHYGSGGRPMRLRLAIIVIAFSLLLTGTPLFAGDDGSARRIVDALLDWDLDLARERLEAWERAGAEDHLIHLYRAVIEVARADYAPERETEKYDAPLALLQRAIAASDVVLEKDPDNFSARGAKATAQAIAGRLLMEQGHWLRAYRMGKSSRNAIRQMLVERPDFADGYLIMGLFEYFTGTIPGVLRWLAMLVDFSGDWRLGIDYLERCVATAPTAAPQAADALLLEVDFSDGEACRYIPLARLMTGRHPRNPRYHAALRRLIAQCDRAEPEKRLPPGRFTLAAPGR